MIPLELWLQALTKGSGCNLRHCPELAAALGALPEFGTLFYIEHTVSHGSVLWYPLSAWHERQAHLAAIDAAWKAQDEAIERAKERKRASLIEQIGLAKKKGDIDLIQELRKELKKL